MPDIDFPTLAAANAEVDRLLAEMPEALSAWMTAEELRIDDARMKETTLRLIEHWAHVGCAREAQGWIRGQAESLMASGVTRTRKVARHLVGRFARAKFRDFEKPADDTEWMPSTERWVAGHPWLSPHGREAAVVDGEAIEYEKHNPCPGRYARNLLNHCKRVSHGEYKNAENFFSRMAKLHLEHTKKTKADSLSLEEKKRIEGMKQQLAEMTKKYASTQPC